MVLMTRHTRRPIDVTELGIDRRKAEPGMRALDDRDDDSSDAMLDPLGEDHGDEEEEEMQTAMTHTCAGCGEENEVLPPKGYKLLKKPTALAEIDSRTIDGEWEPALSFREAYQRRLRTPRTAPLA
jgi:hypothetical protein